MAEHSPVPPLPQKSFRSFSFFLNPLTVTLPFALASLGGRQRAVRGSALEILAAAKSVTVAGWWWGDAGAIFAPASIVGAVSDE